MSLKPAETINRKIVVEIFTNHNVNSFKLNSIEKAISKIKSERGPKTIASKIIIDEDVVYFSDLHGEVENWEKEWERQKLSMSANEPVWDCPHGVEYCYNNDLCMDCQIDKAAGKHD